MNDRLRGAFELLDRAGEQEHAGALKFALASLNEALRLLRLEAVLDPDLEEGVIPEVLQRIERVEELDDMTVIVTAILRRAPHGRVSADDLFHKLKHCNLEALQRALRLARKSGSIRFDGRYVCITRKGSEG